MNTMAVNMSNEQFNSYKAAELQLLKLALTVSPENHIIKDMIDRIEAELKKPLQTTSTTKEDAYV